MFINFNFSALFTVELEPREGAKGELTSEWIFFLFLRKEKIANNEIKKSSQSYIFESEFHHFSSVRTPGSRRKYVRAFFFFATDECLHWWIYNGFFCDYFTFSSNKIKASKLNFQHVSQKPAFDEQSQKCLQCNSQGLLNSFQFHIISTYYYDDVFFFLVLFTYSIIWASSYCATLEIPSKPPDDFFLIIPPSTFSDF